MLYPFGVKHSLKNCGQFLFCDLSPDGVPLQNIHIGKFFLRTSGARCYLSLNWRYYKQPLFSIRTNRCRVAQHLYRFISSSG